MSKLQQPCEHHRRPNHVPEAHDRQIAQDASQGRAGTRKLGQCENKHVCDRVLEPERREARQRQPDPDRLPEHRARRGGLDDGDADADVAEDRPREGREGGEGGLRRRERCRGGRRGRWGRRQGRGRRSAGDAHSEIAAPQRQHRGDAGDPRQVTQPAHRGPREHVFQSRPLLQNRRREQKGVAREELGSSDRDGEQPDLEAHRPEDEALRRRVDGARQRAPERQGQRGPEADERPGEHRQRQHPRERGPGLGLARGDGEVPEGGTDDALGDRGRDSPGSCGCGCGGSAGDLVWRGKGEEEGTKKEEQKKV